MNDQASPAELLARQLRRDGTRPLLTWYDDATGERIELSVATAANWAVKTANLLADEHGLGSGDVVLLRPASHWLSVVALLGAWTAGVGVMFGDGDADVAIPGDAAGFMREVLPQPDELLGATAAPTDVALVTAERSWTAVELVGVAVSAPADCRVLTTFALDSVAGCIAAVVAPLVAGGSSVLVTNADANALAGRARTERVTHTAGVQLDGYPPLPVL